MNRTAISILLVLLPSTLLFSQYSGEDSLKSPWAFSTSLYYYIVPEEKNTTTIIGYADYKNWHFEARFAYEDRKTGSVFGGYRFETGNKFVFGATPIIGFVFGNTDGIAPGLELDASYKIFDYYSETEYVIDISGKENNFLYVWGELGVTPLKSFRTGYTYQRTRLYQSQFEVQQGIFAEYSFWKLTTGVYFFDPFSESQFVIAALSFDF
jgi:hypothetical protein